MNGAGSFEKLSVQFERLVNTVDKLVQRANASLLIGTSSWKEQFVEALTVSASGGDDDDADAGDACKEPSCLDYVLHGLTVFWKLIFAFVPPTETGQSQGTERQTQTTHEQYTNRQQTRHRQYTAVHRQNTQTRHMQIGHRQDINTIRTDTTDTDSTHKATDKTQTIHREDTDSSQTGDRQDTDRTPRRTQTGHRQDTDRTQTGCRQDTDRTKTNRIQADRTHTDRAHRQENRNPTQTGHRKITDKAYRKEDKTGVQAKPKQDTERTQTAKAETRALGQENSVDKELDHLFQSTSRPRNEIDDSKFTKSQDQPVKQVLESTSTISRSPIKTVASVEETGKQELELGLVCPGKDVTGSFFALPCSKTTDCRIFGKDTLCCENRCIKGVEPPKLAIIHAPTLFGFVQQVCPTEPVPEIWDIKECKTDEDCTPRICCPELIKTSENVSYCRTAQPLWEKIPPKQLVEPIRTLVGYMQCTPPPPTVLDLFPKPCQTPLDCFPNLCCQEGGKRYCRPPKRSILAAIADIGQYYVIQRDKTKKCTVLEYLIWASRAGQGPAIFHNFPR
ncbi:unnamed protein product [Phaedon cochleariae]|uniref:Uncharacterized protein n=1 Tax=Phaedon cochleariae TaxID=80249 RepID=A0A9N9SEU6_PHACE|nr:unnamed protein product [Phaedon cochleariae]